MLNQEIGKLGENIACLYLEQKKYRIIDRNYRKKWGELDIIAVAPDKTLVFFEVKTLSEYKDGFSPEANLTSAKLRKLQKTAWGYANSHPKLVNDDKGWRIDLLAITLTKSGDCDKIRHYDNVT